MDSQGVFRVLCFGSEFQGADGRGGKTGEKDNSDNELLVQHVGFLRFT